MRQKCCISADDLHTNQAQRLCSVYAWRRCGGPFDGDADDDLGPELTGPAGRGDHG